MASNPWKFILAGCFWTVYSQEDGEGGSHEEERPGHEGWHMNYLSVFLLGLIIVTVLCVLIYLRSEFDLGIKCGDRSSEEDGAGAEATLDHTAGNGEYIEISNWAPQTEKSLKLPGIPYRFSVSIPGKGGQIKRVPHAGGGGSRTGTGTRTRTGTRIKRVSRRNLLDHHNHHPSQRGRGALASVGETPNLNKHPSVPLSTGPKRVNSDWNNRPSNLALPSTGRLVSRVGNVGGARISGLDGRSDRGATITPNPLDAEKRIATDLINPHNRTRVSRENQSAMGDDNGTHDDEVDVEDDKMPPQSSIMNAGNVSTISFSFMRPSAMKHAEVGQSSHSSSPGSSSDEGPPMNRQLSSDMSGHDDDDDDEDDSVRGGRERTSDGDNDDDDDDDAIRHKQTVIEYSDRSNDFKIDPFSDGARTTLRKWGGRIKKTLKVTSIPFRNQSDGEEADYDEEDGNMHGDTSLDLGGIPLEPWKRPPTKEEELFEIDSSEDMESSESFNESVTPSPHDGNTPVSPRVNFTTDYFLSEEYLDFEVVVDHHASRSRNYSVDDEGMPVGANHDQRKQRYGRRAATGGAGVLQKGWRKTFRPPIFGGATPGSQDDFSLAHGGGAGNPGRRASIESLGSSTRINEKDFEEKAKRRLPWLKLDLHVKQIPLKHLSDSRTLIGEGKFGKVFVTRYRRKDVALKRFHNQAMTRAQILEFKREAFIMDQVKGEFIVKLIGVTCQKDNYQIITEYMPFGSLWDVLFGKKRQQHAKYMEKPRNKLKIADEAAQGVIHLHASDVLHNDLSCRNLLLTKEYSVRLTDFGSSQLKGFVNRGNGRTTKKGDASDRRRMAAVRWTAPEAMLKMQFSEKSDAYSFGMTLFEIFALEKPFKELPTPEVLWQVTNHKRRPRVNERIQEIPKLESLLNECWQEFPEDRPDFKSILSKLRQSNKLISLSMID